MVQGGDPTGTGRGGTSIWGKPFRDELRDNLKVICVFYSTSVVSFSFDFYFSTRSAFILYDTLLLWCTTIPFCLYSPTNGCSSHWPPQPSVHSLCTPVDYFLSSFFIFKNICSSSLSPFTPMDSFFNTQFWTFLYASCPLDSNHASAWWPWGLIYGQQRTWYKWLTVFHCLCPPWPPE